uniref:Solute carrier family 2, facilitated glucose transporter member 9-like isoform X4 n=1 Tax=Geotrypetes seraphini TaxID=260995 RepID=A0A6P8RYR5_GEOSA|nr:solute carrier family 2, facilitated glucose transporter member 9-like isoform X4 [Geotrypetes seraphini]
MLHRLFSPKMLLTQLDLPSTNGEKHFLRGRNWYDCYKPQGMSEINHCLDVLLQVQYQLLFIMICVLGIGGSFHYGFQISVVNAPSPFIKSFINETWQTRYNSYVSENICTLLWSSIVSIYSIGGVIGALAAGYLSQRYGKKKCQLCNSLIPVGAALLSGLSREAGSFEMIMVGRFFLGLTSAIKQLWGEGDHHDEIEDMMREQAARKGTKILSILELLREKSLRWQLYCVFALIIALQLCGINAIYFYSYDVFQKAGFPPDKIPYITLGVGICEVTSVILCSLLVERFGRKTLLLSGYVLMILTLGLLTVTLSLQKQFSWMPFCSVALIFMFNISFGAGPGGVSITMCVEMFGQSSRAAAFVIVGFLNWIGLYLLGMIFPYIAAGLGHFCFLIFLGITAISGIFAYLFLPETKGKSILEISEEFNKLNFRRKHDRVTTEDFQLQQCTVSTKF